LGVKTDEIKTKDKKIKLLNNEITQLKISNKNEGRSLGSLNNEILKLRQEISSISIDIKKMEFKIST
jgi:predicted  nucleic acid-binding Zn-ribbon protein